MSTAAVSSNSLFQQLQSFYQQRQADLKQLGQALQSGDLAGAQQAFNALQTLGQSGPFANADPFRNNRREQDFAAVGQALQAGDLAGAQQAFAALQSTFHNQHSGREHVQFLWSRGRGQSRRRQQQFRRPGSSALKPLLRSLLQRGT
jgi:hypothetical protein